MHAKLYKAENEQRKLLARARHQCGSGTSTHDSVVDHDHGEECCHCVDDAVGDGAPQTRTRVSSNTGIFLLGFVSLHPC